MLNPCTILPRYRYPRSRLARCNSSRDSITVQPANDQSITIQSTRHNSEPVKIPQLEENLDEEQYQDLDTYLLHHNTFEESQHIHQDYRSRLLTLDEERYYEEVERAFYKYGTPAAQDYRLVNQASGPC